MQKDRTSAPARRISVANRPGVYYREGRDGRRRYEITYLASDGRRRWQVIDGGLTDADAALGEIKSRQRRGERVAPTGARLADYFPEWLAEQAQLRPKTRRQYEWAWTKHIRPALGRLKLADVTEDDVARLLASMLAAGLSPHTVRATLTPLSRCLSRAARRGMIGQNPCLRLDASERPKLSRRELRVPSAAEIGAVIAAAEQPYRAMIAAALFTGLRQGELLGLTWGDLDLEAGVVRVRKQLGPYGSRVEPKTAQAVRDVFFLPSLGTLLREHWLATPTDRRGAGDFVFATARGTAYDGRNVSQRGLAPALAAAGLTGERRLRWHDLRHAFASMLIAEGLDVVYVSRQLGHANPSITLKTYSHLFDAERHAARAAAAMEARFGNLLETPLGNQGDQAAASVTELRAIRA